MTIEEIEEEIKKLKREKQAHLENVLEAVKHMEQEFNEATANDKLIESLLRREIEELRRKAYIENRTLRDE